jgi:hypothetical protein
VRTRSAVIAIAGALIAGSIGGCASTERPRVQPDHVPLATPLRSPDAALAGVVEQLREAVAGAGSRLDVAIGDYRPSEPESFLLLPRVVLRADLADAADGFVIVYRAPDAPAADALAAELAAHLGTGIGQSAYAADTRFAIRVLGDAIVFASYSPSRASDADRAGAVFDAAAGVGRRVEVVR